MNFRFLLIFYFLLIWPRVGAALENPEEKIIVIGLNSMNQATVHAIPVSLYRRTLTTALAAVNQSVAPILKKREASPPPDSAAWSLNAIGIGMGLSAQIGLGPLLNVTVSPQLRLVYTDSSNPVYPN